MKKWKEHFIILCLLFSLSSFASAITPPDEGMWLMSLVQMYNYEQMRALGLKLSPEDIYSNTKPSLKDAVVSLGDFCTGVFVSDKGLLFTNHHCGYDAIAALSNTTNDYLDNGFAAKKYSEEIPATGLWVKVLVYMQDVTDSIVPAVASLESTERRIKVNALSERITSAVKNSTGYDAEVKDMFNGNQYFLFVYQKFTDVRFVATPPLSIGEFGGDTDNWTWPRHTGDFSVFRVYANKENKPADFSKDNVPYQPKKFLSLSLNGFSKGDYSMTIGYSGQTNRYATSFGVQDVIQYYDPALVKLFSLAASVKKRYMDMNDSLRLELTSEYKEIMNAKKLWENEAPRLVKEDVVEKKIQDEKAFQNWVRSQPDSIQERLGSVLENMNVEYQRLDSLETPFFYAYFNKYFLFNGEIATKCMDIEDSLNAKSKNTSAAATSLLPLVSKTFEGFNKEVEEDMLGEMMNQYYNEIPAAKRPEVMGKIKSQFGSFDAFAKWAFQKSFLTDSIRMKAFLKKPSKKVLKDDLLYQYISELNDRIDQLGAVYGSAYADLNEYKRLYLEGWLKMNQSKKMYPDANLTMRLSYGTVEGYNPRDAVHYDYQTWLSGVMEKMNNSDEEFKVPDKLYQLWKTKDFGPYAVNGDVPVCFITNNDITGGNSGSPVIDGNGELLGLAFDGDIEGTSGDYNFNPDLNRCICVDVRYILFVMDKFLGAQNLMTELQVSH